MRKSLLAVVAVAALAFSASSYANKASNNDAKAKMKEAATQLKSACQSDVQKLCNDISPGEGRVAQCMASKSDQLSPDCKTAWNNAKTRISERMDKAQLAFRKNCGTDVQKFCSNVAAGRGRLMDCLSQHEDALSNSCKALQAKINTKVDKMMS